jgi:hypothetical protein
MPPNATKARSRARPRKARRDWRPVFLKGFQNAGTVTGGCEAAKINPTTAYRARQRDEAFALKWADIESGVTLHLESRAVELALAGEVRLIEFLLRARRPEMYREQYQLEHVGPGGGPVEVESLGLDLSKLSDRDLASLQRIAGRAR